MDHDVYLILVGAGISLASGIATLVLQFLLSQWSENLREQRQRKERRSQEIRAAILDKSAPARVGPGSLLKRLEQGSNDLDIPTFLRNRR